jgi:predicted transcriptional regulator
VVRSASISIRVEPELKDKLEELARADHRSLASYLERLIIQHIEEKEKAKASNKHAFTGNRDG